MKNWIILLLITGILFANQSCEKTEPDYMNSIPTGLQLLKQVNTYYSDHMIVDTFYYDAGYEIICLERRYGDLTNRFYFENKKLKERIVTVKQNGQNVSYDISYMTDGTLTITNDTSAYLFTDDQFGYYKNLRFMTRKPFGEWNESYICEYDWNEGNLSSACVNRVVINYDYDDYINPMAGYMVWGFFDDDLFLGTSNNRIEVEYQYEYNDYAYPVYLITPIYQRAIPILLGELRILYL